MFSDYLGRERELRKFFEMELFIIDVFLNNGEN